MPKTPKITVRDIPAPKPKNLPPFDREAIEQIKDSAITKPERDRLSELRRRMFREDI